MTRLPPTSVPPPVPAYSDSVPSGPKPYSGAAIAGFVLSLLGCAGITALLGFVLGIVGILSTRDGRRRGMGFAIAAIPISLITGGLSIGLLIGIATVARGVAVVVQLPIFLSGDTADFPRMAASIREFGSDDFKEAVSEETLTAWLAHVTDTHGKLNALTDPDDIEPVEAGNALEFNLKGRFAKGPADITVRFVLAGFSVELDDIEVDGFSPTPMAT